MNAFDLIVTVALGSTLATILLNKEVALTERVTALLLLIVLQFCVTWGAVRSKRLESLVKNEPALLMHSGEFIREAMRRERVTESEIRSAVRSRGLPDKEPRVSVILETMAPLALSLIVKRLKKNARWRSASGKTTPASKT